MPDHGARPQDVDVKSVRALIDQTIPGGLTLLDVRQPWEYEQFHLPGARLVPLGELEDRLEEIPKGGPLVVYCHSGKRSAAAASLLSGQGWPGVMNMRGGIMAWQGATAAGMPGSGMEYFTGKETREDILALAYAMEQGLGAFYQGLADTAANPELKAMFARLAGFEDKHKLVVYHLYKQLHPESTGVEDLAGKAAVSALEGGRDADEVLADTKELDSARRAVEMAMGIEAQAMDLYLRQAAVAESVEAINTLNELAKEERGHLRALAALMDRLGANA